MPKIRKEAILDNSKLVNLLEKFIDKGFISDEDLEQDEEDLCRSVTWITEKQKFDCPLCNEWHIVSSKKYECPKEFTKVNPQENKIRQGYGRVNNWDLELEIEETQTNIVESRKFSDPSHEEKSIYFTNDCDEIEFLDPAGNTVFVPIDKIYEFVETDEMIERIRSLRKDRVNWPILDEEGDQFEEIVYRLIERDSRYFNAAWGGTGPDQGKDGYFTTNIAGNEIRLMSQQKFNNNSSGVNTDDVDLYCRKASKTHDCKGVLIAAVNITGPLESDLESGVFETAEIRWCEVWSGEEIKEKLSKHPDLISEYFIN